MAKLTNIALGAAVSLFVWGGLSPAVAQQHPTHGAAPQPQPTTGTTPQEPKKDQPAAQRHDPHEMTMTGALGIPKARAASGTSWLPDVTPMYAVHRQLGDWSAMLHESLFLQRREHNARRQPAWQRQLVHGNDGTTGGRRAFWRTDDVEP